MENATALAATSHACSKQIDLFEDSDSRWPRKPFCTDDLETGIYPRRLASAIKRKYIQANPPHLRVWSIYDLDYSGAAMVWQDENLPPPSWSTVNRANGHAHVVYGIRAPVLVDSPDMRQGPMRYLCAVEHAYRERLRADKGYSGLITKNPLHPLWRLLQGPQLHYDLSYLAEHVNLPKFLPKVGIRLDEIGLGRNVTLFEFLRHWAYRNVRKYRVQGGIQGWNAWLCACNNRALDRNGDFKYPLDGREVWHISRSTARWTFRTFDMESSDKNFSELQAWRGKKGGIRSGEARLLGNEDKRVSARLMRANGMKQAAIALELGVTQSAIAKWLLYS